jgi:hypothetical protein
MHARVSVLEPLMKKIAIYAAVAFFILLLTKIANQIPQDPPSGTVFALKSQRVIQCSPQEITFIDSHYTSIHLVKDASWPECSHFDKEADLDFFLSRGERTHFLGYEKTVWWRKAM